MTKSELINQVAATSGLSRKAAEQAVNTIFHCMTDALVRGDRIEIRGFGSFKTKHYAAYTGRNPKSGATIEVPAKVLPVWRVGRSLRLRLDED